LQEAPTSAVEELPPTGAAQQLPPAAVNELPPPPTKLVPSAANEAPAAPEQAQIGALQQLKKEKAALEQQAAELERLLEEEKLKSAQAADKADDEAERRQLRLQKFKKAMEEEESRVGKVLKQWEDDKTRTPLQHAPEPSLQESPIRTKVSEKEKEELAAQTRREAQQHAQQQEQWDSELKQAKLGSSRGAEESSGAEASPRADEPSPEDAVPVGVENAALEDATTQLA